MRKYLLVAVACVLVLASMSMVAWCDTGYSYRKNVTNLTDTSNYVNGTDGFCGDQILTNKNGNISVYYNNCSDYAVANETSEWGYYTNTNTGIIIFDSTLLGYWGMNVNQSTVQDYTSNNNDASTANGTTYTNDGRFGGAYSFDGVDDELTIPANTWDELANDFSIVAWVKSTSSSGVGTIVGSRSSTDALHIRFNDGDLEVNQWDGSGYHITPSNSYNDGNWHMVVYRQNSTNSELIVDTNSEGTARNGDLALESEEWGVGYRGGSGGQDYYHNATIDEVRFYSKTLSDAEILEMYNNAQNTNMQLDTVEEESVAPNKPSLNSPSNNSIVYSSSAELNVSVSDAGGDSMNASFYDASDDSQINVTQTGIPDGSTAAVNWSGLNDGTHNWYVIADDGANTTQSDTWTFTVETTPPSDWWNLSYYYRREMLNTTDKTLMLPIQKSDVDGNGDNETFYAQDSSIYYLNDTDWKFANDTSQRCSFETTSMTAECPTTPTGLVSYWTLDGTGTYAEDLIGDNDGTLYNGVTQGVSGLHGAYSFDGTDDYVNLSDLGSATEGNTYTISLWVKTANEDNNRNTALGFSHPEEGTGNGSQNSILIRAGMIDGVLCDVYIEDNTGTTGGLTSTSEVNNSMWHHIVVVQRATDDRELWFAGSLEDTSTVNLNQLNQSAYRISSWNQRGTLNHPYDGDVDDVRVYNQDLSAAEIQSLYNATKGSQPAAYFANEENTTGNSPPSLSNEVPQDGATGVNDTDDSEGIDVIHNITVEDPEGDTMNVTFKWDNGTLINEWTGVSSGTELSYQVENLDIGTTYTWEVNATDGALNTVEQYTYTTEDIPGNITIDVPVNRTVYQRNDTGVGKGYAEVFVNGTYEGSPSSISVKLADNSWEVLDSNPSNGTYNSTVEYPVCQGKLVVAFTNYKPNNNTVAQVGVGDVVLLIGQSNLVGNANTNYTSSHSEYSAYDWSSNGWVEANDPMVAGDSEGSFVPLILSDWMQNQSVPVNSILTSNTAQGGTSIQEFVPGGSLYSGIVDEVNSATKNRNKLAAVYLYQGENDANPSAGISNNSEWADYANSSINNLTNDLGTDFDMYVGQIGASSNYSGVNTIRLEQIEAWSDKYPKLKPGGQAINVTQNHQIDGLHYVYDDEIQQIRDSISKALRGSLFGYHNGLGGQFVNATTSDSQTIDIEIDETLDTSKPIVADAFHVYSSGNRVSINSIGYKDNTHIQINLSNSASDLTVSFGEYVSAVNHSVPVTTDGETMKLNTFVTEDVYSITSCNCPGAASNWEIDLGDYCVIQNECNISTGNITFVNTGNITFNATIDANVINPLPANQTGYLWSNARVLQG